MDKPASPMTPETFLTHFPEFRLNKCDLGKAKNIQMTSAGPHLKAGGATTDRSSVMVVAFHAELCAVAIDQI